MTFNDLEWSCKIYNNVARFLRQVIFVVGTIVKRIGITGKLYRHMFLTKG